ncbi:MAG: helix-turn-helix domain-containing protein, partial [Acidimicrobiia bacterium]
VGRSAVSKWESGKHRWTIDDLVAVCVTFGVTLDQLLLPPKEPNEDWSRVINRAARIAVSVRQLSALTDQIVPDDRELSTMADAVASEQVTAVTTHSPRNAPGSVKMRRDDLSALLFGMNPGWLEANRKNESIHADQLEKLKAMRHQIDSVMKQLEQAGGG